MKKLFVLAILGVILVAAVIALWNPQGGDEQAAQRLLVKATHDCHEQTLRDHRIRVDREATKSFLNSVGKPE